MDVTTKIFVVFFLYVSIHTTKCEDGTNKILKASQCFKSLGIPKVSFSCPEDQMIKIHRAYHGIARRGDRGEDCKANPGHKFNNCTYCENDCIDDSMNLVYDWTTCMGYANCTRTVMQSYMPTCRGSRKFSDYLQVEYQCVPKKSVSNICSTVQEWKKQGYIMSPQYPNFYPTHQDCLCKLQAEWGSKIKLVFYDLLLETRQGRCRADWLMLRQKTQKQRHCGAIMTGSKTITSQGNVMTLQFHSDPYDNRTQKFQYFTRQLKGFWVHFKAEPESSTQVSCRILTKDDVEVKEIVKDDSDYDRILATTRSDVPLPADNTAVHTPEKNNQVTAQRPHGNGKEKGKSPKGKANGRKNRNHGGRRGHKTSGGLEAGLDGTGGSSCLYASLMTIWFSVFFLHTNWII